MLRETTNGELKILMAKCGERFINPDYVMAVNKTNGMKGCHYEVLLRDGTLLIVQSVDIAPLLQCYSVHFKGEEKKNVKV